MGEGSRLFLKGDAAISVPYLVKFDRYSEMTLGLDATSTPPATDIYVNGVALVTGWLSGDIWIYCSDLISTTWADCIVEVSTSWPACYSDPVTTWTPV